MNKNNLTVLSLFGGMECGRITLDKMGIKPAKYYSSEIDKFARKEVAANYPDVIQLGDVEGWREWDIDWSSIDLLIGGSPCQGFSFAGKQLAFDDPRSKLFFVYSDILTHIDNERDKAGKSEVKFMLENVKMKKEHLEVITDYLGVHPVFINSALVSAQNRQRYYWANWEITQPEDKGVLLSDILQQLPDDEIGVRVREKATNVRVGVRNSPFGSKQEWDSPFQRVSKKGKLKPSTLKAGCLTGEGNSGGNHSDMDIIHTPEATRRYSLVECCRLQGVPDDYFKVSSNTQAYKMLGNGWQCDTIEHIFNCLFEGA